jgi:hypothetical protein
MASTECGIFKAIEHRSLCSLSTFWFRQVQTCLGNYLHAKRYLQINNMACFSTGGFDVFSSIVSDRLKFYFTPPCKSD